MEPVGANASAPEQVFWSAIFQVITVNDEMAKTRCIEVLSCDVPDCSPACPQPGDEREFSVFFLRNAGVTQSGQQFRYSYQTSAGDEMLLHGVINAVSP